VSALGESAVQPTYRRRFKHWLERAEASLDEDTATDAWSKGREMTPEQAIAVALG
jgi:hypothetical protein